MMGQRQGRAGQGRLGLAGQGGAVAGEKEWQGRIKAAQDRAGQSQAGQGKAAVPRQQSRQGAKATAIEEMAVSRSSTSRCTTQGRTRSTSNSKTPEICGRAVALDFQAGQPGSRSRNDSSDHKQ